MIVYKKQYTMRAGTSPSIFDAALAYATILVVKREGIGWNKCQFATTPGNREYLHTVSDGSIDFQDYATTLTDDQKVLVIYKY